MVQVRHGHETISAPMFDRRTINKVLGVGAVTAFAAAGIFGFKEMTNGGKHVESDTLPDYNISPSEAMANINALAKNETPDDYSNAAWADPTKNVGRSNEELIDSDSVPMTPWSSTDPGFAEQTFKKVQKFFYAGQDPLDVINAMGETNSLRIGERDKNYNDLGNYPQFVDDTYECMGKGLFLPNYERLQEANGNQDSDPSMYHLNFMRKSYVTRYQDRISPSRDGVRPATLKRCLTIEPVTYERLEGTEEYPDRFSMTMLFMTPDPENPETTDMATMIIGREAGPNKKYIINLEDLIVDTYFNKEDVPTNIGTSFPELHPEND